MANKKISELSTRTPSLSDLMLVGDPSSGYSYKCTITSLATIIETDIADGYVTLSTAQTISGAKTFSNNLTLTSVSNAGVDTDKFLVLNGSNVVNFRTGSEVLSDIGGQGALTLTTTGTSGAATLVGNTLNIPQYQAALTNPVTGTGTTNYLSKFTGSTTIGNSLVFDNGTSVGIGTTTPTGSGIEIFNDTIGGRLRLSRDAGTTKGIISFGRNNAGTFQETGRITGTADNASINNGVLTFNTSDSAGNSQVRLTLEADGNVRIATINNATTDTDKFLVSDDGRIKYRTGSELLSDIGGQGSLTLTTTGSSGSSTLVGNTLNVPTYTLAGLGGISLTSLSALAPLSYNNTTGVFSIALATASTDGYLRFQDWNFFADKIGGSGTTNYIPKFTSSSAIGNSQVFDNGTNVGINQPSPTRTLDILGASGVGTVLKLQGASGTTTYLQLAYNGATDAQSGYIGYNSSSQMQLFTSNTLRATLDASGNLGLGVTPSAWISYQKSLDFGGGGNYGGLSSRAEYVSLSNNAYLNTSDSWTYKNTATAAEFILTGNQFQWRQAPSGTANTAISFTQAMTLDASGRLGIGATSPGSFQAAANNLVVGTGSGYEGITLYGGTTGGGSLYFADGTASTDGYRGYIEYDHTNDYMTFGTAALFAMRINSSGNVGIGTTSLFGLLNLQSGTNARWEFSSGASATLELLNNARNAYVDFNVYANNYIFNRLGAESMRIDASGNLGLGVSPSAWLSTNRAFQLGYGSVRSFTNSANTYLENNNYVNTSGTDIYLNNGAAGRYRIADEQHIWYQAPSGTAGNAISFTQAMTLDASGRLGIGTTNPDQKLTINQGATGTGQGIPATTGSTQNGILRLRPAVGIYGETFDFGMNVVSTYAWMQATNAVGLGTNYNIAINPNGGNVGIGTTSPDAQLVTNGSTSSRINMRGGDVRYGTLYADNGLFAVSSITSIPLVLATNDIERMRITSGGEVYIGNNPADQGAYNLQVNGTGVWGAGAYVNGSDSALKENIFDLDGCLDLVKQLKPVTYKYKQSYSRDTSTQTGFIAQDLKELFKDKSYLGGLVKEGGQHLSVAYQNLIPLLVKAIQEQQAEIEILKNK